MQRQVWRYNLKNKLNTIEIPEGGIVRHIDNQKDNVCMWVEVEMGKTFEVWGTGHAIVPEDVVRNFLGTAKLGDGFLVFHVYERIA